MRSLLDEDSSVILKGWNRFCASSMPGSLVLASADCVPPYHQFSMVHS